MQGKGVSVTCVEKAAGLSNGLISKWNFSNPTVENLRVVAEVLGCNIYDFYCNNADGKDEIVVLKSDIEQLKQRFEKFSFSLSNVDIQTMREIVEISQMLDAMLDTCELQDAMVDNNSLLERIKLLYKERKIPLYKLEDDLGFAKGYIGKIDKSSPSAKNAKKIAKYLGVAVSELIE